MQEININSKVFVFNSVQELDSHVQELFKKAIIARENAYAPYSNFKVGAALLLEGGTIVTGNNQENAAFPSGLCAERVAIFQAGALFPNVIIKKLAIVAGSMVTTTSSPTPPCGSCLQSMIEYELKQEQPIEIYFKGEHGKTYLSKTVQSLLPFTFNKKFL